MKDGVLGVLVVTFLPGKGESLKLKVRYAPYQVARQAFERVQEGLLTVNCADGSECILVRQHVLHMTWTPGS